MINVIERTGSRELAEVYLATVRNDPELLVEFVDACGSRRGGRRRKWVVIVSTQLGCPVKCLMCDAGTRYRGNLSSAEIMSQVDRVVSGNGIDPNGCDKFKVQFARMGEPALNNEVLKALWQIKDRYTQVIPCVATIAPAGRERWFATLLAMRDYFRDFQLQFSVNSTDPAQRDLLMPYPKMPWRWMALYGRRFYRPGQRKTALNFAVCSQWRIDAGALARHFDPRWFAVKLTPLNPTATGSASGFAAGRQPGEIEPALESAARELRAQGYDVIVSVGDLAENGIGSNCGQSVQLRLERAPRQEKIPAL